MDQLSTNERAAVERIDAPAMLARVERWAAVNSGTRHVAGCATMAGLLADAFAALPGEVRLVEPAAAHSVGADGVVSALEHGRHLHLSVRPDAAVRVLLTGHMDTVYPVDHPFQTVAWREPGVLGGPGVADMKGGLALMLEALLAIEASDCAIGYDVVINSDEETGSFSSAALLAEAARGKVAALTYEPSLPDGTLAGARGGTGNFSIIVRGRAAHAGRNPEDGRNAVAAAAALAVRLHAARSPRLAVNPARVDGGGPNNVVPDLAILRINFRPRDADEIARAGDMIRDTVAAVTAEYDVAIEVHGGFNRPPKPIDAGAARLFATVRDAGAALGQAIAWRDTGGVCDGNNIAACGVPVVDTMGARGGAIHSSEEFLIVDSLGERAALSAVTLLRIAAGGMA
ncbi:MAG: hydrolase [Sphingomonas adhaesiva]|uniref:hydrolase n=1 Tax=Sphingomonas adhaesiva TaxID=28212 RepID=UPI002FF9850C